MKEEYILAIDQGTTGTKVLLFDANARVHRRVYQEITQHYPQPGWVEHDPVEVRDGVFALLDRALAEVDPASLAAIAVTNQRETALIWDRETGEPLTPAVVWQCRRTSDICRALKEAGCEATVRARTGLYIDPYFSASKVRWLLDNTPGLRAKAARGGACFGTVDAWLLWHLTGGRAFVTDCTNASRTLLYNIYTLSWDDELLAVFDVPRAMLPEVRPSSHPYGTTSTRGRLPAGVPVTGIIGDSQGALFGEACYRPGSAKATYGTGTSLMMFTGYEPIRPPDGLVATLAWGVGGRVGYALEGVINVTGAVMQWLRDGMGIIEDVARSGAVAAALPGNEGVYLVPGFAGLGAPYWDMDARGLICGLTRGTTRAHLIRAGLESIAYQVNDVAALMQEGAGVAIAGLRADGGAAANDFLMQFQADILGVELARPSIEEVSALGAAYLAGLGTGIWDGLDGIEAAWRAGRVFRPEMPATDRQRLVKEWRTAVRRALSQV